MTTAMEARILAGRELRLRLGGLEFIRSLGSPCFRTPAGGWSEDFVDSRVTLPMEGVFTLLGHPIRIPPGTRLHITAPTRFHGPGNGSGSAPEVAVDLSGAKAVFGLEVPGGPMGGGWVAVLGGMLRQHLESVAVGGLLRLESTRSVGEPAVDGSCGLPEATRPGCSLYLGKRCLLADLDLSGACRSVHLVPLGPIVLEGEFPARIEALDLRTDRSGRLVAEYNLVGHPLKDLGGLLWVDARGHFECGGPAAAFPGAGPARVSDPAVEPDLPADGTIHVGVWAWAVLARRVGSAFGTLGGAWARVATTGTAILAAQLMLRAAGAESGASGPPVTRSRGGSMDPAAGWSAPDDGFPGDLPAEVPAGPVALPQCPDGLALDHRSGSATPAPPAKRSLTRGSTTPVPGPAS